ncbi:MAG: 4-alpha-glucanotransferase, partial [Candidatus Omnitrophica bacterium]|nr:4-alpha-glucanotransferase [Candidatus Omnitrophota bacterium]
KAWLEDYSLFVALKEHFQGLPWHQWPDNIRGRKPDAMQRSSQELKQAILKQKFFQYIFMRQWTLLRQYGKAKGVRMIGDLPIYVQHDSVDVWANPSIFKLDKDGHTEFMAGVPPDYFSKTGQLWGNPVYDWDVLKKTNYEWWRGRLAHNFSLCDIVRIDHFRGFVNFWQVPQGEETAINGSWEQGPGHDFLDKMLKAFKSFPIIAEDLGFLSEDVVETIQEYKFPGMKILLFAFDSDDENPYLPHNHIKNCIVYTGTHDNNTAKGWFQHEATEPIKHKMFEVLGEEPTLQDVAGQLVYLAMESVANTVILPMQDILGLDETCRMNIPGTPENNWEWRLLSSQVSSPLGQQLMKLTQETKRV